MQTAHLLSIKILELTNTNVNNPTSDPDGTTFVPNVETLENGCVGF